MLDEIVIEQIWVCLRDREIVFKDDDGVAWVKSPVINQVAYQEEDYPVFWANDILYRQPVSIKDIPADAIAVIPCLSVYVADKSGETGGYEQFIRKSVNLTDALKYPDWMITCSEEECDGWIECNSESSIPDKLTWKYTSLENLLRVGLRK